jgi:hypothetical protein
MHGISKVSACLDFRAWFGLRTSTPGDAAWSVSIGAVLGRQDRSCGRIGCLMTGVDFPILTVWRLIL